MEEVRMRFTIGSCRAAVGLGLRMGGTLTPVTEADGERLIEHCHVVTSRARLVASGQLRSDGPVAVPSLPFADDPAASDEPRSASG
jgi:hypothetical protein